MMEDEEDPVVLEIPVFLSRALSENLYIYQYPVKPNTSSWNDSKVVTSLIKPKNKCVKLEFGLDTYSDKYCQSKGEQIALNTDGSQEHTRFMKDREREKAMYFKSGTMDKLAYESTIPKLDSKNYVVGIVQDQELHCTPINAILQMRPNYTYYDKQDKRAKDIEHPDNANEEDDEEPEAQQITIKFARQESEVAIKTKDMSYDTLKQRLSEEPWYDSVWWHSDSDAAELERLKLFSSNTDTGSSLALSKSEYLKCLVPLPPVEELIENNDKRFINKLSILEQCKAILKDAKLLRFTELCNLVRPPDEERLNESAVLSALSTGAGCMVQGLWTARSQDVYSQPSVHSGVPAQVMAAARDYVIYLFSQSQYIDRRKVTATIRLPTVEVLEIIQSIAKYNKQESGWELLKLPDTDFVEHHPDIVERQILHWEAKQKQFNDMLSGEANLKRQRKKSQRDSISGDTLLSPKTRSNSFSSSFGDEEGRKRLTKSSKISSNVSKRSRNVSCSSNS